MRSYRTGAALLALTLVLLATEKSTVYARDAVPEVSAAPPAPQMLALSLDLTNSVMPTFAFERVGTAIGLSLRSSRIETTNVYSSSDAVLPIAARAGPALRGSVVRDATVDRLIESGAVFDWLMRKRYASSNASVGSLFRT